MTYLEELQAERMEQAKAAWHTAVKRKESRSVWEFMAYIWERQTHEMRYGDPDAQTTIGVAVEDSHITCERVGEIVYSRPETMSPLREPIKLGQLNLSPKKVMDLYVRCLQHDFEAWWRYQNETDHGQEYALYRIDQNCPWVEDFRAGAFTIPGISLEEFESKLHELHVRQARVTIDWMRDHGQWWGDEAIKFALAAMGVSMEEAGTSEDELAGLNPSRTDREQLLDDIKLQLARFEHGGVRGAFEIRQYQDLLRRMEALEVAWRDLGTTEEAHREALKGTLRGHFAKSLHGLFNIDIVRPREPSERSYARQLVQPALSLGFTHEDLGTSRKEIRDIDRRLKAHYETLAAQAARAEQAN